MSHRCRLCLLLAAAVALYVAIVAFAVSKL